jgi:hypothetical protein
MRVSRLLFQLIAISSILYYAVTLIPESYNPAYHSRSMSAFIPSIFITTLLLPIYVLVELWWRTKGRISTKALIVDAILTALCLCLMASLVVLAFSKYGFFSI